MQNLKSWLLNGRILLVLVLLALFAGCSDDDKGSTAPEGSFERLWSHATIQGCARCHEPMGEPSGPNLTKSQFRNSLVGKYSKNLSWNSYIRTSNCGDKYPLVSLRRPNESAVLMAVSQRYGSKPPADCTPALSYHTGTANAEISGNILKDFEDWILNGAPAN